MSQVFITGDKHGIYDEVAAFCRRFGTTKNDLLIVLGDNGVNYYGPTKDRRIKNRLEALPITFLMIKGNHDQRPSHKLYHPVQMDMDSFQGVCLVEDAYPSLLFSDMSASWLFKLEGRWKRAAVLGGAYSADKWYRLEQQAMGRSAYRWFADEQMTQQEMADAYHMLEIMKPDLILSHTCPLHYEPKDMFLQGLDQGSVDQSMEAWMDTVEATIPYQKWYCGHWHTDRSVDKLRFMYHDIIELSL